MPRLAVFPKCWIDDIAQGRMDLFEWIDLSVQLRCDGLELHTDFLKSHRTGYLRRIRKQVESSGMTVPIICHSPDFTVPDHDLRRKQIQKQVEMIRVTAELGGRFCRTLSGQRRPEVPIGQGIEWVVACIEDCLPVAEACGVVMVMENHYKEGSWTYPEFAQQKEVFFSITYH